MARCKQTARKSTGTEAPRNCLSGNYAVVYSGIIGSKRAKYEKKPTYKPQIVKRTYETRASKQRNGDNNNEKNKETSQPKVVAPGDKKEPAKSNKKKTIDDEDEDEE